MKAVRRQATGFTIVELLIVIVVIGILAAITIVAYSGIQTRAENTKTNNALGYYAKALQLYATNNGLYPTEASYPCLGPIGTNCANITDGTGACFGSGGASAQASFDSAIKTVLSTTPVLSTQSMNCGGKQYSGAYYYSATGKSMGVTYYLRGNQSCTMSGGFELVSRNQADDTTVCSVKLPNL